MDIRFIDTETHLALCEIEESMLKACELISSLNELKDRIKRLSKEADYYASKPYNCS
jgi:hypothetical protein